MDNQPQPSEPRPQSDDALVTALVNAIRSIECKRAEEHASAGEEPSEVVPERMAA